MKPRNADLLARETPAEEATCRFCGAPLHHIFVDLGMSPLCESYLSAAQLDDMEPFYPLRVYVCEHCFLVQLVEYVTPADIFGEYAYFSSYSDSWLAHARDYVEMATLRFNLDARSLVIEVGSNDGYLLQYWVQRKIPVLGIEPAQNVAQAAIGKGVPTRIEFFGTVAARALKAEGKQADLIVVNNVLAQAPQINDFCTGLKLMLKPNGVITLEFPHLMQMVAENQFDTIYQEHYSYFSFLSARAILAAHGLTVFNVEELETHGGSLRVYARHAEDSSKPVSARVPEIEQREKSAGLTDLSYYASFGERVQETKRALLELLNQVKRAGNSIAAYGAPGKGNTLLNYCGIRTDYVDFTVDRNPYKQNKFLPGTHIPIFAPDKLREAKPDYVLILPWNLQDEIMHQVGYIEEWGGRFIVPIPTPRVIVSRD